jgi:hypothetical protein
MKTDNPGLRKLIHFIGSKKFFWIITAFFVIEAAWLACSALYPMAFDEDFHFGLIKLYAHHVSPFWTDHPAGGDAFGALTRDPSYLYHYLMSFPYRLISSFTDNQTVQVMLLRFINIGFATYGLILYRKLLLKTKASTTLVNLSLLIFVLVPILPYLAGQINYDNLLLPLTAGSLLLALKLRESFKKNILDIKTLLILVTLLLITSLVKYAFLPIFVAIAVYLLIGAHKTYKHPKGLSRAVSNGAQKLRPLVLIGLTIPVLLSGMLFIERYGINLARYHAPVANCSDVLDFDHCKSYGPWIRDYYLTQSKGAAHLSALAFNNDWFHGMWFRSFFAISGPSNGFHNSGPLTWPAIGTIIFASVGIVAFIFTSRRIFNRYNSSVLWLLLGSSLFYVFILWLQNYQMYQQTGRAVAINGRYLLPIVPVAVLLTTLGFNEALKARTWLKLTLGATVLICFVWGGGALTWILRSQDSWHWPNSPLAGTNRFIQRDVGPYVPGYRHPEQYMPN